MKAILFAAAAALVICAAPAKAQVPDDVVTMARKCTAYGMVESPNCEMRVRSLLETRKAINEAGDNALLRERRHGAYLEQKRRICDDWPKVC